MQIAGRFTNRRLGKHGVSPFASKSEGRLSIVYPGILSSFLVRHTLHPIKTTRLVPLYEGCEDFGCEMLNVA
jgi:hypothetical protein